VNGDVEGQFEDGFGGGDLHLGGVVDVHRENTPLAQFLQKGFGDHSVAPQQGEPPQVHIVNILFQGQSGL
jgi:hypothetical protein